MEYLQNVSRCPCAKSHISWKFTKSPPSAICNVGNRQTDTETKARRKHNLRRSAEVKISGTSPLMNTGRRRYNAFNFDENPHKRKPIARPLGRGMGWPVRTRYGLSFVHSQSDLYHASGNVAMHAISCLIGSIYNGTRLYDAFSIIYKTVLAGLYNETMWYTITEVCIV